MSCLSASTNSFAKLERACAEYQIVRELEAANRTRAAMAKVYTIFAIVGAAVIAVVAGSI